MRKLEVQTVSHRARIKTWLKLSSVASVRTPTSLFSFITILCMQFWTSTLTIGHSHFGKQDFIHAATTYGKIIISEAYVPAEEKTIKPLSGRGIAGGEKYIVRPVETEFFLWVIFGV